jgi:hypothetical protein
MLFLQALKLLLLLLPCVLCQAMLLTDASEKLDPMSLLFYMSSFSVLLLVPMTVLLEPGSFAQVRPLTSVCNAVPSIPIYAAMFVGPLLRLACCSLLHDSNVLTRIRWLHKFIKRHMYVRWCSVALWLLHTPCN